MSVTSKPVWIALTTLGLALPGYGANLARVGGKTLTDKDLKASLMGVNEGQRDSILKDAKSRRQLLTNIIDQEVLTQEAEREKLDQTPEFKEAQTAFRRQYLANRIFQKYIVPKMTDKDVKAFYEANKANYNTDQVHVQHILVETEDAAKELLKKVNAPGADFQAIAEKESKDPSAKSNRGDLGMINQESPFVKEFKDAAFAAKLNEVTPPIKTSFGYHLIKVTEKKVGKPMEFGEVELRVRSELRDKVLHDYLAGLKKKTKVEVDEAAISKL